MLRVGVGLLGVALAAVSALPVVGSVPVEAQSKPVVYLTFDDGPGSWTPLFLDVLDRYDAQATFFHLGQSVAANPGLAQRVRAEGHGVGNHSYTHPRLVDLPNETIRAELIWTNQALVAATGRNPACYRPPYGATNSRVHGVAVGLGLTNQGWTAGSNNSHWGLWDIDTNDWRLSTNDPWTEADMRRQLDRAGNGDVVLLHDGGLNRGRGLAVLTSWLEANQNRFDFRALPGCGGAIVEPAIDPAHPELWHRFQIARLYRAYFDRAPDSGGWSYWNQVYSRGATVPQISGWFSEGSEFGQLGPLSNRDFVIFVYREVMDREPDSGGLAYWVAELNRGLPRGDLLFYFSESREFLNRTTAVMTGTCWNGNIPQSYACWATRLPPPERWE